MKKLAIIILLLLCVSTIFTACTGAEKIENESETRKVIEKDDKTIVLLSEDAKVAYQDIVIENISKILGYKGISWLNDGKILASKENKSLYKKFDFHVSDILANLYLYDIKTGESLVLGDENFCQVGAKLSPDKKYVYYVEYLPKADGERALANGIISDLSGNRTVIIDGEELWRLKEVIWSSDNEIMLIDGSKVQIYDLSGDRITIESITSDGTIGKIGKSKNNIYFTCLENKSLSSYNIDTRITKKLESFALDFTISPDGNKLILTKVDLDIGKNELILVDLESGYKEVITEGSFIYGVEWVLDSSRISYLKKDDSLGLYVMLMNTKKEYLISPDFFGQGSALWNPSGQQLMIDFDFENSDGNIVEATHIITLK